MNNTETAEHRRLEESRQHTAHWKRWGPYLSERAWALYAKTTARTVRRGNTCRTDQARSRAYR